MSKESKRDKMAFQQHRNQRASLRVAVNLSDGDLRKGNKGDLFVLLSH